MKVVRNIFKNNLIVFNFYEVKNNLPVLVLLHAQGTNALSFENTFKKLSKYFHIYAIDYSGHGLSDKNKDNYNIVSIGNGVIEFIKDVVKESSYILGHSSGGLIAAYVASKTPLCKGLILEDPPFFSCQGERRYKTYNYLDLSTVCHNYIETKCKDDFVLYYFDKQKMWEFFPEKFREKVKPKLMRSAKKYRIKHPNKSLKIPFFPKSALAVYQGLNEYDPYFGEAFYNNSFHAGISHVEILKNISCKTLLMKAKTGFNDEGVLLAAMSEEDALKVKSLISNCEIKRFDCGHGVHIEKKKMFINSIILFANKK